VQDRLLVNVRRQQATGGRAMPAISDVVNALAVEAAVDAAASA
jgi:hypothetical protein